jgi:hypothetical protein
VARVRVVAHHADHAIRSENIMADWVTTRSQHLGSAVFERLQKAVETDVQTRNKFPKGDYGFRITSPKSTSNSQSFSVERLGRGVEAAITFEFRDHAIRVLSDDGKCHFVATPTLNEAGEFRFLVDGKESQEWQLRYRALDALFFGLDN